VPRTRSTCAAPLALACELDGATVATLLGTSAALVGWLTLGDPRLRGSDAVLRESALVFSLVSTASLVSLRRPIGARPSTPRQPRGETRSGVWMHALAALGVAMLALGVQAIDVRADGGGATSHLAQLALPLRVLVWMLLYALIAGALHAVVHAGHVRRVASAVARLRALSIGSSSGLRDAELRAIEDELDPHLVGNALHTAATLVRRDPQLADQVIQALASLAESALRGRIAHEVPLAEELSTLRQLLPLEHARMRAVDGSLDVRWDIAPDTLAALVPAMVLQPLVENAVRHGLAPRGGVGRVVVHARRIVEDGRGAVGGSADA
jgi:hypothetical protein